MLIPTHVFMLLFDKLLVCRSQIRSSDSSCHQSTSWQLRASQKPLKVGCNPRVLGCCLETCRIPQVSSKAQDSAWP